MIGMHIPSLTLVLVFSTPWFKTTLAHRSITGYGLSRFYSSAFNLNAISLQLLHHAIVACQPFRSNIVVTSCFEVLNANGHCIYESTPYLELWRRNIYTEWSRARAPYFNVKLPAIYTRSACFIVDWNRTIGIISPCDVSIHPCVRLKPYIHAPLGVQLHRQNICSHLSLPTVSL